MRPYELYGNLKHNFISQYINWARTMTDACLEYHIASALMLLATVAGNQITYAGFGGRVNWPNLYVILIGPSGISRKSTVIGMVDNLLSIVDTDLVIRGEQSREAFMNLLKDHPVALLPLSEFRSALSLWKKDYQAGFKECVTDLYDPYLKYKRRLIKESYTIEKPALNIYAGTTVDWLREGLTSGDLRGGFMGRFLIIENGPKEPDKGIPEKINDPERQGIIDFLSDVYLQGNRNMRLGKVKEDYNMWLKEKEFELSRGDDEFIGFISRVGSHCLKILALDTVAEYGPTVDSYYEPTSSNLSRAITLTEWLVKSAREIAEDSLGAGKFELALQRILHYASGNAGIERKQLLRKMKVSSDDLDKKYLKTLLERGQLMVERGPTGGRWATIYRVKEVNKVQ